MYDQYICLCVCVRVYVICYHVNQKKGVKEYVIYQEWIQLRPLRSGVNISNNTEMNNKIMLWNNDHDEIN